MARAPGERIAAISAQLKLRRGLPVDQLVLHVDGEAELLVEHGGASASACTATVTLLLPRLRHPWSSSYARVWKLLEGVGRRPVGLSEVWWCRGTPRHPEAGLCDARGEPWPVYKPGWTGARRRSGPSRLRSFAAPVKGGSVDPVHGLRWGTGASARVNI